MNQFNLYVWDVSFPDWTNGLAFAITNNLKEAKDLVEEDVEFKVKIWGNVQIYPLNRPIAFAVYGGS